MDFARDDQLDKKTLALKKHAEWRGKLEIKVKRLCRLKTIWQWHTLPE